jgi:hypothetical protein
MSHHNSNTRRFETHKNTSAGKTRTLRLKMARAIKSSGSIAKAGY